MMDEEEILRVGTSLEHMGFSDDHIDDYFEHHGVKGMHWGVRKRIDRFKSRRAAGKAVAAKRAAKEQAQFDQLRKKLRPGAKKLGRAADIQRARDRIDTGAHAADKKAAKEQFKKDKQRIGRKEARRILRGKKDRLAADVARSQEAKSGLEAARWMIEDLQNQMAQERRQREWDAQRAARASAP
jgi:hypothetical protein